MTKVSYNYKFRNKTSGYANWGVKACKGTKTSMS